jgi:putative flippase GtrA
MPERATSSVESGATDLPRHRRSLPVYVGAGGIATASHYLFAIVAVELFGAQPLVATTAGFALGAAIKYWLNYTAAFASRAAHSRAMMRFVVALAALMALNTALFSLLNARFDIHYLLAQALVTVLLIPPGYYIHRHWVYRAC